MEPLTDANSWLEVMVKRQGEEAAWEKLDGADVPEDILAAFVQDKHRSKAIPLPGGMLRPFWCLRSQGRLLLRPWFPSAPSLRPCCALHPFRSFAPLPSPPAPPSPPPFLPSAPPHAPC